MRTKGIFRKWEDGQIIALFPSEFFDLERKFINSYMHIEQHGGASPELIAELEPASPDEYKDLKEELESIGYELDILNEV